MPSAVARSVGVRMAALTVTMLIGAGTAGCASADTTRSGFAVRSMEPDTGYTGVVLEQPYAKPALELRDTAGRPYVLARDARAPVTLVFFGFTSCTDECPAMLANVAAARDGLEPQVRERIQTLFISTDPKRDTPRAIRAFLDGFDPSFEGLTGSPEALEQVAADLGIALTGVTRLPGGGYDVGHSSQLIGFAPDGLGRIVWLPDKVTVPGLRADLRRLVEETSGPVAPRAAP